MRHLCTTVSRNERDVSTKARQESGFGHADHVVRGRLLADIDAEGTQRTLFRDEIHTVCGLPAGSLDDGTLSTPRLVLALARIAALPNTQMNLSGRHHGESITVLPRTMLLRTVLP